MPKTGRGKARKETGRSQYRATAPVCTAVEMEEEEEGESGEDGSGEAKEEQLEGLERNDMMLISRMELKREDERKRKRKMRNIVTSEDEDEETEGERRRRRKEKRRRREMEEDIGASWEGVRKGGQGEGEEEEEEGKVRYLLPLKTRRGLVHQPAIHKTTETPGGSGGVAEEDPEIEEEETEEADEDLEVEAETRCDLSTMTESTALGGKAPRVTTAALLAQRVTTAALLAQRQEKIESKMTAIAELASSLVESPEENVYNIQSLLSLCTERGPAVAYTVRKMAMASLVAVFRDVAPSYHIRELTAEEKAIKVSKDVRKLRVFEESLLSGYQRYLTLLDHTIRVGLGERRGVGKRRREKKSLEMLEDGQPLSQSSLESLAEVALRCMCDLTTSLPHFNFRNNLLAAIVPRMTSKALGGKVSRVCCDTIEKLFREDLVGEVSLEAVVLITKLVKSKSYNTKPTILRTFLHLQLHSVDGPVGVKGRRGGGGGGKDGGGKKLAGKGSQLTRKQRKRLKAERELERDLRETEATESTEKKTKLQTEILQLVFATYFRVLKSSRHSPLMQPVLEGLAKFAQLISVDFFSDLMSVLHTLAETGGLSNRECMLCVLTAFEIFSGQGEALNIDPRQFYTQLYVALLQVDVVSSSEDILLALECMDKMLRKRRQVSLQRVLGFVKRLSTVSLQLLPGACLAVLATVRKCMTSYSQCEQLLDSGGVASGVFRPDVADPEMSQAGSSLLWELTLYTHHYSPSLCSYATHLLHGAPTHGRHTLHPDISNKSVSELHSSLSLPSLPLMPGAPPPPPHPAMKLSQKKGHPLYFYSTSSGGINDDVIRLAGQEADKVAQEVTNQIAADL